MIPSHTIAEEYSPEAALLVLMLRVKYGTSPLVEVEHFIKTHNLDYDRLFLLCKEHEVESILDNFPFYDLFDSKIQHLQLRQRVEKRAKINLLLFAELIELNSLMSDNGFNVIFYKGVLLSQLLYDDFTTRISSDIDILIRAEDFILIRSLLLQNGYEDAYYFPVDFPDYYLQISREFSFKKRLADGLSISIETQWAPLPPMFNVPYNNDYFFEYTTSVRLLGKDIPILKNEQLLLILLLHHGASDLWRNFKHISDLAMFLKRYTKSLNWTTVIQKINEWNIDKLAYVGFYLCKDLFDNDFPIEEPMRQYKKERKALAGSLLSYPLLPKQKKNIKNANRQLMLCNNLGAKIKLLKGYLKTEIMPSTIDLQNQHFPPSLFPLYFVTKRFRFLYKKR